MLVAGGTVTEASTKQLDRLLEARGNKRLSRVTQGFVGAVGECGARALTASQAEEQQRYDSIVYVHIYILLHIYPSVTLSYKRPTCLLQELTLNPCKRIP